MDENPKNNAKSNEKQQQNAAASVVRAKLDRLYGEEPDAKKEIAEVKTLHGRKLSKHQLYMDKLSRSGKSLADIQTEWHRYYQNLPDDEKHEVWQEFYKSHEKKKHQNQSPNTTEANNAFAAAKPKRHSTASSHPNPQRIANPKEDLLTRVAKRSAKNKRTAHLHSLIFGLGMGSLVIFIIMFSFFNERFITPFIRPSVNVSATPIIVDPNSEGPVGKEPKIIIPKINVEAPVVYDEPSIEEKPIQKALERGVVHYAITPRPGEAGNSVIVGHSSSNILNSGKYKFAFLLLKSLENGDTFIVHKDGTRYVYKVYNKFVTNPKDISVLNPPPADKKAIVTLITCDPPGMSTNRLIVQAEQIFPSPEKNKPSSVQPSTSASDEIEELPSNAPSLWQRITDWL